MPDFAITLVVHILAHSISGPQQQHRSVDHSLSIRKTARDLRVPPPTNPILTSAYTCAVTARFVFDIQLEKPREQWQNNLTEKWKDTAQGGNL